MSEIALKIGDCRKLTKELEDESMDLVLTDPPYGIAEEIIISRARNPVKFKPRIYSNLAEGRGKPFASLIGDWDSFPSEEEMLKFTFEWIDLCNQKLRKGGMFITWFDRDKINFISKHLKDKFHYKTKGYFAMIKSNPVPQARKVKWMNSWEIVGLWQKPGGKLTYNFKLGQHADYMINPIVSGKERLGHPTQKPEKVVKLFIEYWTEKGDWVLDPFAGSGTTGKVCQDLGRNCMMYEIDSRWKPVIESRLKMNIQKLEDFRR